MILELDIGNTRAKWRRITRAKERLDGGSVEVDAIREAISWQEPSVDEVRISSVAGDRFDTELSDFVKRRIEVVPRFARAVARAGRIRSGYHDASQLGVDRWLSMLAAGEMTADAFAVVDGGSAITLDLVGKTGDHLGGFIAPGLAAMRESLRQGTARVRPGAGNERIPTAPGRSTRDGVNAGIVRMMGDFVVTEFLRFANAQSDQAQLFITGGDGEILAELCAEAGIEERLIPELVLDGLAVACP